LRPQAGACGHKVSILQRSCMLLGAAKAPQRAH
jgi:hypothetical protein